jgi:putative intracellular protease/amidase
MLNSMTKVKSILKWSLITIASLIVLLVGFGFWFMSLIPSGTSKSDLKTTQPEELSYLSQNLPIRGKILAVVTSTNVMGNSGKSTGYELTELSRAYYVFQANGFEVDIASPLGGEPPVVIDLDDMGAFDFAFLNDPIAQSKTNNTIPIDSIESEDYQAVFFVGGKGAMFDFPENDKIQSIIKEHYQSNKVIGAVCHGPAALVNVTLDNGSSLLENKTVTSFTNAEELFLIPNAIQIFPFLLQDKLEAQGATFNGGHRYLEQVSQDGNLVTGQNPWSTWAMAESMITQMGYTPKLRVITPEENAVKILSSYESAGYSAAKTSLEAMIQEAKSLDRTLIAMHSIVSVMDWDFGKSYDLIRLLNHAKGLAKEG